MALWKIEKKPSKITITYVNLHTGLPFNCGDQHPDTDVDLILQWVRSEADPGDVVLVDGQVSMHVLAPVNEARAPHRMPEARA